MQQYFINPAQTRWVYMNALGQKDLVQITLKSGATITRTAQFREQTKKGVYVRITYKQKAYNVYPDTIIED